MPTQEHSNGVWPCQRAARLVRSRSRNASVQPAGVCRLEAGGPREDAAPAARPSGSTGLADGERTRLVARYGAPVLAAGHTAVPNLVRHHWRALGATYGDFYLYLVVMERKRTAEHPRLRVAEIARAMGAHERQVREHVARLQRLGLLLVRPGAGNRAAYDFSPLHTRVVALDQQVKSATTTAARAPARGVKHPLVAEENAPYRRNVPKTSSSTLIPPTPIDSSQASDFAERQMTQRRDSAAAMPPAALSPFPGPAGEEDDAELVSLVQSLSQEFGDPAAASNVTQARRHRHDAQVELSDFVVALQEAARRTRERRHRLANPMGYLFTVLRDLLFNQAAKPRVPTRHHAAPARAPRRRHCDASGAEVAGAYALAQGQAQVDAAAVTDGLWRAVLCDLAETMTPGNFETWLRETVVVDRDERRLVVGTPNAFARDWLSQRLHGCVSRSLERLGHGETAVEYVVCQTAGPETAESLAV